MYRKFSKKVIICVFIITLTLSCSRAERMEKEREAGGLHAIQSLAVDVYQVPPPSDIPVELQYPARTKSIGSVTIVARVSGTLQKMLFKEGQAVEEGDILFKIEPDTYEAEVNSARAKIKQALANLKRAKRDWNRVRASFKDGVASEKDRDATLAIYETTKAEVDVARAALRQAELNLNYTSVRATISGITGEKMVDLGNMVNPGAPLVTITQTDPIFVDFSFPDSDLMRYNLSIGMLRRIKEDLYGELLIEDKKYPHRGRLDFIDTVLNKKTSTLKARAVFPNPEKRLFPEQFVRIIIRGLKKKAATVVPQKAVLQGPTGAMVFLVMNGKVEPRPVKLGNESGGNFIVEEGLKPDELVIVNNLIKIRPGMPVRIDRTINGQGQ